MGFPTVDSSGFTSGHLVITIPEGQKRNKDLS
jgi:hypothetical protein